MAGNQFRPNESVSTVVFVLEQSYLRGPYFLGPKGS